MNATGVVTRNPTLPGQLCINTANNWICVYRGDDGAGTHEFEYLASSKSYFLGQSEFEKRIERLYRYDDTLTGMADRGGRWADRVFPKRTPWITLVRLAMRELPELYEKPADPLEIADAVILVLDVAYQQSIDIQAATVRKMDMNDGRVWEHREDGMMYHVKQPGEVE